MGKRRDLRIARYAANAMLDGALVAVKRRLEATKWAGDARLLRIVMAELEYLRVTEGDLEDALQSDHDPEE